MRPKIYNDEEAKEKKKQQDKERIRKVREKYRQDKLTEEPRRLDFFRNIMSYLGINVNTLSIRCQAAKAEEKISKNIYAQKINWWLVRDDCFLAEIQETFKALDLDLTCELLDKTETINASESSSNTDLIIEDVKKTGTALLASGKKTDLLDKMMNNKDSRLAFLAKFIIVKEGGTKKFARHMEKALGMKERNYYARIPIWAERNDIKISKIYEIAEVYGIKVQWKLKRRDQD